MDKHEKESMRYEASQIMKDKHKECANCGSEENIHIHHIVPLSQGGGNKESNLVFLCAECHKKAHAYVGNRVKEHEEYSKRRKITHRMSVLERTQEIKKMAKELKICRPFLFKGFKEYVELLYANDPSVLSKDDIALMELLMYYRELGMTRDEFEKFLTKGIETPEVENPNSVNTAISLTETAN